MTFGQNFLPGPTGVHPTVLESMTAPMFAPYGPDMGPILDEVQPTLQDMLGTRRPVFAVTSSGTGLLEAAIRNAVRRRVLVVIGGFFGGYFARIAESCGKEVVRAHVPFGRTLEADQLAVFLDGPPVDAVAVVHSESSTGALAPLDQLAAVVRDRKDVLFLVDAISSAGALPIDMDRIGIDCVVVSSQKALAVPPGLAIGAVSERLEERAKTMGDAGFYFSLARWARLARDRRLFETPALSVYFALQTQLRRITAIGGWPVRWARHRALAARMHEWALTRQDLRLIAAPDRRSPTVSALELTQGHDPRAVQSRLADDGWLISRGFEESDGPIVRIGHMGDIELDHLDGLLTAFDGVLANR